MKPLKLVKTKTWVEIADKRALFLQKFLMQNFFFKTKAPLSQVLVRAKSARSLVTLFAFICCDLIEEISKLF